MPRVITLRSYIDLSLSKVRELTRELSARVALGHDIAGEKQERKAKALRKMEEEKHALRVSELAAEYFERQILDRWKHPDILRRRYRQGYQPDNRTSQNRRCSPQTNKNCPTWCTYSR